MASDLYSHSVLQVGQIRLLTLLPGSPGSLLHGTLSIHNLGCPHQYKALSYTWGTTTFQVPIYLNGQLFHVGGNLHAALTELRDQDKKIILWVDAVCINQKNFEEKGVHVPLMHHVYHSAEEVIVWLGRKSEDSDEAMDLIQQLAISEDMDDFIGMMSSRAAESSKRNVWRPLVQLFTRPWWHRVWVLQEVAFGRNVTVVCGSEKQPWVHFAIAGIAMKKFDEEGGFYDKERPGRLEVPDSFLVAAAISLIAFDIVERFPFSLEYAIVTLAGPRRATDPRDMIFGILNLVTKDEWPCEPDYNTDVKELYIKVARFMIEKTGKLNVLANCSRGDWVVTDKHLREKFQRTTIEGLPSWVPDWSMLKLTTSLVGRAKPEPESHDLDEDGENYTPRSFRFEDNDVLLVSCKKRVQILDVDVRLALSHVLDVFNTAAFNAFTMFIARHLSLDDYSTNDSMTNLLFVVEYSLLTCNSSALSDTCFPYEDYVSWRQTGQPLPNPEFLKLVRASVFSRVLVWTVDGEFGLAPWGTRQGDWVAHIEDCSVPLILRTVENREIGDAASIKEGEQYSLLSDAFVLGWQEEQDENGSTEEIRLL